MDWQNTAKLLARVIAAIGKLLGAKLPAEDALTIISALIEAVKRGDLDKLDPARAEDEIEKLIDALKEADDAADKAVDEKFDESG